MPIPADPEVWNPNKVYQGALNGVVEYVKYQGGTYLSRYYSVGESPAQSDPSGYGAWTLAGVDTNEDGNPIEGGAVLPEHRPVYVPAGPDKVDPVEAVRATDTTMTLAWDRAYVPGLGDVTSYNVYQDGVKIGTTTGTVFEARGLTASTSYNFQVEAINLAIGTTSSNGTPGDASDDFVWTVKPSDPTSLTTAAEEVQSTKTYSPYMDMTLPSTNLTDLARDSGVKDFTLAFMQGLKSQIDGEGADAWLKPGETPTLGWGGISNTTLPTGVIIEQVREVQRMGGEVTVSFGGYTGRDIAVLARQYGDQLDGNRNDAMTAAEEALAVKHLKSQFQYVMDTYGVDHLDFDIENSTISGADADKYQTINDTAANHIRNLAIKQLQAENPGLHVSYTVATTPNGLNDVMANSGRVLQMFKEAQADGVKIDVVNIMAMDYFSGTVNIDMGQTAINAAKAVYKQLTDSVADGGAGMTGIKIGITPMIGLNDYWNVPNNLKEIFTLQDAQEIVDFAKETPWVSGVGAWQLTRDRFHSADTTLDDNWDHEPGSPGYDGPSVDYENPTKYTQDNPFTPWDESGQLVPVRGNGNVYPGPDPSHSDLQQAEWAFSNIFGKMTKEATGGADIIAGGDEANSFRGLGGNDRMWGYGGNDILNGGTGADTMNGGTGNDTFLVDNAGDVVVEVADGGIDAVKASANYVLGAAAVVERLMTVDATASTAINLTGNAFNQAITGNAGANTLNGGGGVDTMTGLGGNDTYYVDSQSDVVVEGSIQGTADRVLASVSYTLGATAFVEILATTNNAGVDAINLVGNGIAQTITGNAGANVLSGGGGKDTMQGLGGADRYLVDSADDIVIEAVGGGSDRVSTTVSYTLGAAAEIELFTTSNVALTTAISLTGNAFAQTIQGNAGNNFINGGLGNDQLQGFGGQDSFLFNTALGASNVDRILDFSVVDDTIRLENAIFTQIAGTGVLTSPQFAANIDGAAADAFDRIIYETDTGRLYYDADGSDTGSDAIMFAVLQPNLTLTNADFLVV